MIVHFAKPYLQELYENGTLKEKKHFYQPEIVRKYQQCVEELRAAKSLDELEKYNSLHLEELKGDKYGSVSVRMNEQYRV